MKVSAVISEFNPFHDGHKYLINKARENGSTHIVAVMSGNFVQRGDCAIYSKWDRAVDAVKGGVDLVIEIPSVKSCSSASNFAVAGVEIAEKCGCIDELFFGSECNNLEKMVTLAEILEDEEYRSVFDKIYAEGYSYPAARKIALDKSGHSDISDVLDKSNDILAVEYVKAIKKINSSIKPVCFPRIGQDHDCFDEDNYSTSALSIRKKVFDKTISPKHTVHSLKNAEKAVIYKLRGMSAQELRRLPDVDEGLENRLKEKINSAITIEEFLEAAKTKRYTYSRLSRILLCAFLSIKREEVYSPISYIKVLAFNDRGREILKTMKQTALLPIIMRYSDVFDTKNKKVICDYKKEICCSDVFALTCEKNEYCGMEQKFNAIYVNDVDKTAKI